MHKFNYNYKWIFTVLLILPLHSWAVTDDIRIVIDVSGSMKKTDPSNLRAPALKLLNGLIPTGATAGVWTFGKYVNRLVKPAVVNDRWRKSADAGAAKIHSNGLFTNIESALKHASTGWRKPNKNARRSLILLTDGRVDISKNESKNKQSRQAVLTNSIKKLKQVGAQIHAIALSKDTDEVLLKRLALETGGSFEIAESAKDLQRIFFKMFERATQPDSVPLTGNSFAIDKSIKEMTLLIFKDGQSKATKLFPPGGGLISRKRKGKSSWRGDTGYDLITIKKPKNGLWKIEASGDNDNRVMVITDLKLAISKVPAYLLPNQDIPLSAELLNKNKRISKNSFLKFVDFSVIHTASDGTTMESPLAKAKSRDDKGLYFYTLNKNLDEGKHEIVVTADSRTFNRSKRFNVQIQWPVKVQLDSKEKPGIYNLSVTARDEYIDPGSLKVSAEFEKPDGNKVSIKLIRAGTNWNSKLDATSQNGLHKAFIKIEAVTLAGESISYDLGAYPMLGVVATETTPLVEEEIAKNSTDQDVVEEIIIEETGPDWVVISIIAGVVNVLLLLIGGFIFVFIRKKRKADDLLVEEEAE